MTNTNINTKTTANTKADNGCVTTTTVTSNVEIYDSVRWSKKLPEQNRLSASVLTSFCSKIFHKVPGKHKVQRQSPRGVSQIHGKHLC